MRRARLALAAALAAAVAAVACAPDRPTPLDPGGTRFVGAFTLTAVNGRPVPARLWAEAGGASGTLVGERIALDAAGGARRHRTIRFTDGRGAEWTETSTIEASYRIAGAAIEIGWFTPCPPNANCVGNDTGTWTPGGLRLASRLYWVDGEPAVVAYERE